MPRSIPRRIEALEGRRDPRGAPERLVPERFLADLEALAGQNPPALPPALLGAWRAFAAARDDRNAGAEEPPPDYRPDLPAQRRRWRWRNWDSPRIDRQVCGLLTAVVDMDPGEVGA